MFCPQCGAEFTGGVQYCPKCGALLSGQVPVHAHAATPMPDATVDLGRKTVPVSAPAPAPAPVASAAPQSAPKKSFTRRALLAGVGVAVLAGLGIGAYALTSGDGDQAKAPSTPQKTTVKQDTKAADTSEKTAARVIDKDMRFVGIDEKDNWTLYDLAGNQIEIEQEGAKPLGRFSEGFMAIAWVTSGYDKEWDSATDIQPHVGCVDKSGKLVLNFDEVLKKLPGTITSVNSEPFFHDGLMVLVAKWQNAESKIGETALIFNTKGELVFSVGDGGTVSGATKLIGATWYRYGCFMVRMEDGHIGLLDGKGAWLANPLAWDSSNGDTGISMLGEGLTIAGSSSGTGKKVFDYQGNLVLDLDAELSEYDEVTVKDYGDGTVTLTCIKKNPYENGQDKRYDGIYDVANKKWLFGPYAANINVEKGFEGVTVAIIASIANSGYLIDEDKLFKGAANVGESGKIVLSRTGKVLIGPTNSANVSMTWVAENWWQQSDPSQGSTRDWKMDRVGDDKIETVAFKVVSARTRLQFMDKPGEGSGAIVSLVNNAKAGK